ncbi:hypothetical protein J0X19_07945 [Hymenobacter sp. BT186]|uniref:Uncharacterized protein n=1 Tax=Hymenobacter telluris TaxID=2816474 RepID=A0A939EUV2_9BACT|nr:hypothetical protein [Hymenobacter telluris]MBO0357873.1 hypothetical protein [Hymenobacter telluris]MBW3373900.1 hypothetical protein [Hymenobacter norwichensis]
MINNTDNTRRWLEAGKQIGKNFSYTKDNKLYYASVGIQKCGSVYKLYFDEIEESQMGAHEDYLLEEIIDVQQFNQLSALVYQKTGLQLDTLTPLKGQKIFNPDFH